MQLKNSQDKVIGAGSISVDGSISNTSRVNDQASKIQIGRKRKQAVSSSGPTNSSGTANSAEPSPSSAPSTPSTHTVGDAISKTSLPNGGSSKSPRIFGSDGMSTLKSTPNQLLCNRDSNYFQPDVDHYMDDGSLDDNVDSFLTPDADPRDTVGRSVDVGKGGASQRQPTPGNPLRIFSHVLMLLRLLKRACDLENDLLEGVSTSLGLLILNPGRK